MKTNWNDFRHFIEVAKHGSLSAAANKAGVSIATLSRRIDALEKELNLKLLVRRPTGIKLTDHGDIILQRVRLGGERFHEAERTAAALQSQRQNAPIIISSTETVLSEVLAPNLTSLFAKDEKLMVDLRVSNENVNLSTQEADLAIRLGKPISPGLITRRVGTIHIGLFAASEYLAGRAPEEITLSQERLLSYDDSFGQIPELEWMKNQNLEKHCIAISSSSYSLLQATKSGVGMAMLPVFLAHKHQLVRIPAAPIPVRKPWLVFHRDMRNRSDVQQVKEWVIESCQQAFNTR